MGEHLPLSWLAFEASVAALVRQGTDFASLEQVRARRACVPLSPRTDMYVQTCTHPVVCSWLQIRAVASDRGITDDQLATVLSFYHDLGVLVYFGGDDVTLRNTVILNPAWLVDMFRRIITAKDHQVRLTAYQSVAFTTIPPFCRIMAI